MVGRHNASRAVSCILHKCQHTNTKTDMHGNPLQLPYTAEALTPATLNTWRMMRPSTGAMQLHTRKPSRTAGMGTNPAGLQRVWGWEGEHRRTTWCAGRKIAANKGLFLQPQCERVPC